MFQIDARQANQFNLLHNFLISAPKDTSDQSFRLNLQASGVPLHYLFFFIYQLHRIPRKYYYDGETKLLYDNEYDKWSLFTSIAKNNDIYLA